jgi:hypothetical protein
MRKIVLRALPDLDLFAGKHPVCGGYGGAALFLAFVLVAVHYYPAVPAGEK